MKVYIVINTAWDDIVTAFKTKEKAINFCENQNKKVLTYSYYIITLEVNE